MAKKKVIRAAKLGEAVQLIEVDADATLMEVVKSAGGDMENFEVRVNNNTIESGAENSLVPVDQDIVTMVPAIKGGK